MSGILQYIRNLIGFGAEPLGGSKRDRADDGCSSEDDTPAYKRHKLSTTYFPDTMNFKGVPETRPRSNIHYVPIQVEPGHPSTSTPLETGSKLSRLHAVPVQVLKQVKENSPSSLTPGRKPRMHTPVRRTVTHVIDDDDEEPEETSSGQRRPPIQPRSPKCNSEECVASLSAEQKLFLVIMQVKGTKRIPKVYIDLEEDEDNNHDENDDEIQFVKKVSTPPPTKPYQFFLERDGNEPPYSRLPRRLNDRKSMSPKTFKKFVVPPGIKKSYKKAPTPVSKWLQSPKSSNLPRNKSINLNGNIRSTMAEVFNLDEKKNYRELIKKVADSMKPGRLGKSFEFINLTEEATSFRNTQRAQRKALNEISLVESGLFTEKENNLTTEYDPITVASINSSDSEVEVVPSETSNSSSSVRITPINTLRDSHRGQAVTSTDFLSKLDTKYKKRRELTQEKLKDAKRESDIISKVNLEQKLAHLEHKLKYELSIPESLYEEPKPSVELPPLSPQQLKLVEKVLGPGPPGSLLISKFNMQIHKRDIQTLAGLNWLNDEVINFYMNLLMQRCEERKDLPRVYACNTFFYPKLMASGQPGLRRWTKKVDIFAHDLMILPVHLGVHWCLCIVDFREKQVSYLDSMGGPNPRCLDAVFNYLKDEHREKKGQPMDDNGWKTRTLKDIPQQMNGSDCGMFSCTFAEFSSRDAPYTFTQSHMPYLRRKMVLEIVTGKLLL